MNRRTSSCEDDPPVEEKQESLFRRPFEGRYDMSVAVAIIALAPFIVVSTAYAIFSRAVQADLHGGRFGTQLIAGFSIAGYACGALLGGYLVQRFRQRRLFLICQALFVSGCAASAAAQDMLAYGFGRILSGFGTGLLLVIALPPVIQRFPSAKLRITVVWVNIGFFGAVCGGPLLGGVVAGGHHWRWFYAGLGAIGLLNLIAALLTLPVYDPPDPDFRFDGWAIGLGLASVVLPFWAAGELAAHGFASPAFILPLAAGMACFIALLLVEYHQEEPLSPVKLMWTTISLVGTLIAMVAGSMFVAFLELAERLQMNVAHRLPLATGILFSPLIGGVCITAALLGLLLRTRFLPFLVLGGMACLVGGGALIMTLGAHGAPGRTLAAAALLGLGAGATVSPGLYLAGFPLSSTIIGRVFALVELVRSLADYIIAPVIAKIAELGSRKPPLDWPGVHEAAGITLWITLGFTVIGIVLWMAGGAGLPVPDISAWIDSDKPALRSPRLFARLRGDADEGG